MLSEFFDSPVRIRELTGGPGGALFEGFGHALFERGYAEITARRHLRAAEHLMYWVDRQGLLVDSLNEYLLKRFYRHLGRCRCPRFGHSHRVNVLKGASMFLAHLRDAHVVAARGAEPTVQEPSLLTEFCRWMRQQRGVSDGTLYNYGIPIRRLLRRLGDDPCRFDARSLRQYVIEYSQQYGWAATKNCTTALRMFLRFLSVEGRCTAGLESAIPVVAHWRLASLPKYLQAEEVERLIASCDLDSPVGKRDRAILLLLARLGLRAGDIVQLLLNDIDWKGAEIHVFGKGRRHTRLPLTQEIGQAVAAYLQYGRPRTTADALFVSCRAPFQAFGSHCAVSVIVDRALHRAGVTRPSRGAAHLLRHSAAASMLRQGASLRDIAAVLRHRSIETTQIYAKVDVVALQQIVQPWPRVPSC